MEAKKLIVSVATLAVLVSGGGQARATFPGQEGDFLITKEGHLIYRVTLSGEEERIHPLDGLTQADGREPVWSPTGDRIAFGRRIERNPDIYVMDADGSDVVRITDHAAEDRSPAWSPDADRIVYVSDRSGKDQLFVKRITSDRARRIRTDFNASEPTWSPDGERIAFVGRGGHVSATRTVYTIRVDGTGLRRITDTLGGDLAPSWSPDGERIAFLHDRYDWTPSEVVLVTTNWRGKDPRETPLSGCEGGCYHFDLAWSPRGDRIGVGIYVQDTEGFEIRTVRLDGEEEPTLYNGPSISSLDWGALP